jgi:hypothetical protein
MRTNACPQTCELLYLAVRCIPFTTAIASSPARSSRWNSSDFVVVVLEIFAEQFQPARMDGPSKVRSSSTQQGDVQISLIRQDPGTVYAFASIVSIVCYELSRGHLRRNLTTIAIQDHPSQHVDAFRTLNLHEPSHGLSPFGLSLLPETPQ